MSDEPVSKRLRTRNASAPSTSQSQQPPTTQVNDPSTSLDSSDECWRKIFEYLDVEQLCQMANVCKRFRTIAEQVVGEKHRKITFEGYSCKQAEFRRAMCKFGSLLTSIDAANGFFETGEHLDMQAVIKYCPNLEQLAVQGVTIICDEVKPLFSRLKSIWLIMCDFIGNKNDLFTNCPQLEDFMFEAKEPCGFVAKKFPNLKDLRFDCNYPGYVTFFPLIRLNPQVKRLHIMAEPEDIYINAVTTVMKQLEQLIIQPGYMASTPEIQTRKGLLELSKLKTLTALILNAGYETYAKLVGPLMDSFAKQKVPIEHIDLTYFEINAKDIRSMAKLKTIKDLILHEVKHVSDADLIFVVNELPLLINLQLYFENATKAKLTVDGLAKMIKNGKQLRLITLSGVKGLKIDRSAFDKLAKAAQARKADNKLTIDIVGHANTTKFNVPDSIQQASSTHLVIDYSVANDDE